MQMLASSCAEQVWQVRTNPLRSESEPSCSIRDANYLGRETMKSEQRGINTASKPSGNGCVGCLVGEGWWLHLPRCAECGHIGCCDSSPSQHASKHAALTGHSVVASFEPGEDWFL